MSINSINSITPQFNNITPNDAVDRAKALSDAKDESTDSLTQNGLSVINSSHGRCALIKRNRDSMLEVFRLETQTTEDYFNELLSGEH